MEIKEIIVVEGRDDTRAIKQALDAQTIETHGFGISEKTFKLIEKAYQDRGIIVFTDPDHAGDQIRKRILERFPKAKEAHLIREDAKKGNDIGIENASPQSIINALKSAKVNWQKEDDVFSMDDMVKAGLVGFTQSKDRRQKLGKILGIGYANSSSFLKKLNGFGISREEFFNGVKKL